MSGLHGLICSSCQRSSASKGPKSPGSNFNTCVFCCASVIAYFGQLVSLCFSLYVAVTSGACLGGFDHHIPCVPICVISDDCIAGYVHLSIDLLVSVVSFFKGDATFY